MQMNIFLRQCVLRDSLPFAVEVPKYKPEVLAAMEEAKGSAETAKQKIQQLFGSIRGSGSMRYKLVLAGYFDFNTG